MTISGKDDNVNNGKPSTSGNGQFTNRNDAENFATENGGEVIKLGDGTYNVVSTPDERYTQTALDIQLAQLGLTGEIAGAQLELSAEQVEIAKRQQAMAEEQYGYWKRNFAPVERDVARQAKVGLDATYFADRAGADVTASFDKSKGMLTRDFSRMGIDPSSAKVSDSMIDLEIARAVAEAGARNQARNVVTDVNYQRKLNVAQLGRNIPGQAASISGQAAGTYGAAAGTMSQANAGMQAATNSASGTYMGAASMGLQADQFQQNLAMQNKQINAQQDAAMWGAIGSAVGVGGGIFAGSL